MSSYDALVLGGGHNGLVCGAYLAKAGRRVVILEAGERVGGATDTSSPWPELPDCRVSTYSYVVSLMSPAVVADLELARHGYALVPQGPDCQLLADGEALVIDGDDPAATHASIARFSKRDADRHVEYVAWLDGVAKAIWPLFTHVPPRIGSLRPGDLLDLLRTAWKVRGLGVRGVADVTQLFAMSATDFLSRWFESEALRGMLASDAVIGAWGGPDDPGTAYVLLHHSIGDAGGATARWGYPIGGMGAVASACRRSAESHGAEVRTRARVAAIRVRDGRATGVVLEGGEEIAAPIVVSAIHPKIAFLELVDRRELPDDFVRDIECWKSRSGVVKINLALSELPDFRFRPGTARQRHHTGTLLVSPSTAYLQRAFEQARGGRAAERPYSEGVIPSASDPSLAPDGLHIASLFTQYAPEEWAGAPHREECEAFADRVVDAYTDLAPNFRRSIIARQVLSAYDMEREIGLVGGNIFHGELSLDQIFHMRPAPGYADFTTPIRGLFQGSAATHGGGGVTGIAGWQAARKALRYRPH
jgi:phytoene dehydrogenase-like protein